MHRGNLFYVEKILKKKANPILKYLVKWEGYDMKHSTWEPIENLKSVQYLVDEFEAKQEECRVTKRKRKREVTEECKLSNRKRNRPQEKEITHQDVELKNLKNDNTVNTCEIITKDVLLDDDDEVPEKIVEVKQINNQLYCLISFKERPDGIVPEDCYISSSFMTEMYPKMLIDFYESKLEFID